MKRSRLTSWMLVVCALFPAALVRCNGQAQGHGTETGNPPFVKKDLLRVVIAPGGVRVVGGEGAVSPGAAVNVVNQRTGESARGSAGGDGSVDVFIAGESTDVFTVTVQSGGKAASVTVTASEVPEDLSQLSCTDLENTLGSVLQATFQAADRSCDEDSDCVQVGWGDGGAGCYIQCGTSIISEAGHAAARTQAERRTEGLCNELAARPCPVIAQPCVPLSDEVLRCEQNQCVGRQLSEISCQELGILASEQRVDVVRNADRTCEVDADCMIARSTLRCFADCTISEPVARSANDAVESALAAIDDKFCSARQRANDCAPVIVDCAASSGEPTVSCVAGECTLSYPE